MRVYLWRRRKPSLIGRKRGKDYANHNWEVSHHPCSSVIGCQQHRTNRTSFQQFLGGHGIDCFCCVFLLCCLCSLSGSITILEIGSPIGVASSGKTWHSPAWPAERGPSSPVESRLRGVVTHKSSGLMGLFLKKYPHALA